LNAGASENPSCFTCISALRPPSGYPKQQAAGAAGTFSF
jgi:hypothetical protein